MSSSRPALKSRHSVASSGSARNSAGSVSARVFTSGGDALGYRPQVPETVVAPSRPGDSATLRRLYISRDFLAANSPTLGSEPVKSRCPRACSSLDGLASLCRHRRDVGWRSRCRFTGSAVHVLARELLIHLFHCPISHCLVRFRSGCCTVRLATVVLNVDALQPVAMVKQVVEACGNVQKDFAVVIGSQPYASEVLNVRQPMTLHMIWNLSAGWKLLAEGPLSTRP